MMEGETRITRPSREWLNDIEEWCGEEIHIHNRKTPSSRYVENGGEDDIGHLWTLSP